MTVPAEIITAAAERIVDRRMRAQHWHAAGLEAHRAALMIEALPDATAALEAVASLLTAGERQRNAEAWDAVDEILAAMCVLPVASPRRNDLWRRLITVAERRAAAPAGKPVAEAVAAERERCRQVVLAEAERLKDHGCGSDVEALWHAADLIAGDQ